MYRRADPSQQWSLHAEVTISHNGPDDQNNLSSTGTTRTEQDPRGVRMVYSWSTQPQNKSDTSFQHSTPSVINTGMPPMANSGNYRRQNTPTPSKQPTSFGFQRGNIFFTSTPPERRVPTWDNSSTSIFQDPNRLGVNIQDSGYNSEQLLSPNSASSSIPRRPLQPYNRRCKSTCSIILSTDIQPEQTNETQTSSPTCSRTQSLRCQTPTKRSQKRNDGFYGCGDPWCYHTGYQDTFSRFSPVPESCEECSITDSASGSSKRPSRANTFSTHFCTKVPEKSKNTLSTDSHFKLRDASSQTLETKEKCTSPLEKLPLFCPNFQNENTIQKKDESSNEKKTRPKKKYNIKHKTDPLPTKLLTPESIDSLKSKNRLSRSPAYIKGKSPLIQEKTFKTTGEANADHKPRTVHIDVYCTGSDADSDTDSSSNIETEKSGSTPQTVYETDKVRVTHKRVDDQRLPLSLLERFSMYENSTTGTPDSDIVTSAPILGTNRLYSESEDTMSSCYPSQMSSYATIRDFDSSLSSVPCSWSTMSTSSCAIPGETESTIATSWKDTISDFDSLFQSGISLPQCENRDYIPKYLSNEDIDVSKISNDPSIGSILQSDSFEYADSSDKYRIRKMEQFWNNGQNIKSWKSPSNERKYLLQQQKMKEYLEKRTGEQSLPKWESKETESEETEDDSERGWSFVRNDSDKSTGIGVQRDSTIRRASKDKTEDKENITNRNKMSTCTNNTSSLQVPNKKCHTPKSPSEPPRSQMKTYFCYPEVTSEFISKAQKFGSLIQTIHKLERHVGPAKNPDCLCRHCRIFYDSSYRTRTRSVGDMPEGNNNWREQLFRAGHHHNTLCYTDY